MKLHDICTTNNGNIFIHTTMGKHSPLAGIRIVKSRSVCFLSLKTLYANFLYKLPGAYNNISSLLKILYQIEKYEDFKQILFYLI